jgi:hypothetical protein
LHAAVAIWRQRRQVASLALVGLRIRFATRRGRGPGPGASPHKVITREYKALNEQMHREQAGYGVYGRYYVSELMVLSRTISRDILDYGCGKRLLESGLGFPISNYDPGIPGLDAPPAPADVVACIAVLEHVEPDALDAVLADLARVTRRAGFLVIGTATATKMLPDGRNAHLIVEPASWWEDRLLPYFRIRLQRSSEGLVTFVVQPRG